MTVCYVPGGVLNALATVPIVAVKPTHGGYQVKFNITLRGGQPALFKPNWSVSRIPRSDYLSLSTVIARTGWRRSSFSCVTMVLVIFGCLAAWGTRKFS